MPIYHYCAVSGYNTGPDPVHGTVYHREEGPHEMRKDGHRCGPQAKLFEPKPPKPPKKPWSWKFWK